MLPYQQVVEVYVALTDGTCSVQRSLGAHASFLDHHQGSADSFMSEVCLDICWDGPAQEPDLFMRDAGWHLWLNGFSRRCAAPMRVCIRNPSASARGPTSNASTSSLSSGCALSLIHI